DVERSDLAFFRHKYRLLLGERMLDGNGTGKDIELGKEILEAEKYNIVEKIDLIKDDMDCLFVVSAIGGGIGGAVYILLDELRKSYTEPVYYAGILPSEEDFPKVVTNFSRNFKKIVKSCDAIFPVDIDSFKGEARLRSAYNVIDERVFRYLSNLFAVGEHEGIETGGSALATSDVLNTLAGVTSVGLGTYESYTEGKEVAGPELIVSLTEDAIKNLSLPVDIKDSRKVLVAVFASGRERGFVGSIPARLLIEKKLETAEVRGGDIFMRTKKEPEVMLVLSGVRRSERLKYLYHLGKMFERRNIYSDSVPKIFSRLENLNSKISEVVKEFKLLYKDTKKIAEQSRNKRE
ncbi:MAG: hypothetical protein ACE5NL_01425, partial [Candidatus Hydrothermarchaeaceae archaeon]